LYRGPSQSAQGFRGNRRQHPDPGTDFWIFYHCGINKKVCKNDYEKVTMEDKEKIFWT